MKSITVPPSVTSIEPWALSGFTDIYYLGNEEQWNSIEGIDRSGYNELPDSTVHYGIEPV